MLDISIKARTLMGKGKYPEIFLSTEKFKSKNKLNQRNEKMLKQKEAVKQDEIVVVYSLNKVKDL